jgi:dTMP kinase
MPFAAQKNKRGRFIVIEGIDGSGKSTQISLLAKKLTEDGRRVYTTAEPTVSMTGGMLRDALRGVTQHTTCEIAAMFLLDRIAHNVNPVNGIEKFLASGVDVICDRYYYSSLAYQGSETDFDWVLDMNINCPEIRKPDLCIFLDLEPDKCLDRISKNRMVKEIYEEIDRLERYRKRYFEIFDMLKFTDNIAIIDTNKAIDEIADEVYSKVAELDV